ncbi:MAG: TadE/TadG family type IV pilus assembly protein [Pirellulales bacterium]
MHTHITIRPCNRGVAATELAIVLPLLALLALVGTDLGRATHAYLAVGNAARVGAEYGSLRNVTDYTEASWEQQIQDAVREEAEGTPTLDSASVTVDIQRSTDADDLSVITVETTYPFEMIVDWPGLPATLNLRRTVTMRQSR